MSSFSNDSFNTGNGAFNENNWPTGRGPFDAIVTSESSRFVVHTSVERAVSAESIRATTLTNGQTTTTWTSMLMKVPVADAASTATYAMTATSAMSAASAQIAETARYAETAYAATVATNASSAMYATSAGRAVSADTASHASFATYATSAGHADEADTAAHASEASYASEAFAAYHASFADSATTATYAERVRVMNSSGGTLWTSAVNTDSVSSADVAGTANNVYAKNSTGGVTQTSCIDTVYSAHSAGNAALANRAFEAAEADRASSAYSVRVVTRDNENNTGTQYTDVISKVSQAWWADSASRAALAYTASSATFANYAKSVRVQTNTASTDTEWRGIIDLRSIDPSLYTVASASSAISFVSSDSTYAISDTSAYVDTSIANSANYVRSQTGSLVSETAWVTAIGDARSAQYATSAGTATVANSFTVNGSSVSIGDAYTSITHDTLQVSESVSSNNTAIAQISSDVGNKSLLDTNNKTNLVAAVNEVNAKVDSIPTGLVPQGTIAFEDLPDLANVNVGWMYNISDDFTTDDRFIIPGISEKAGSNVYAIEDGTGTLQWTPQTSPTTHVMFSVAYGNGLFVAIGSDSTIFTSPDAITWTRQRSPVGYIYYVAYGNGLFVAVGNNDGIITSPDGITWTQQTSPVEGYFYNAATYGNGLFVIIGSNGVIITSSDGITWTQQTSPVTGSLSAVTYGNGLFVAVGNGIITSPDGATWTEQTPPVAGYLTDVTYGDGLFVAAIGGSNIITSPDGITWAQQTSPVTGSLSAVTYGNGLFVVTGGSNIITSPDGITWTQQTLPATSALYDATYGSNLFVVVGGTNNAFVITGNYVLEKKWDVFAAAPIIQVDQTYSPTSGNPQSGTAVAEAIQQVTSTLSQLTVSSASSAGIAKSLSGSAFTVSSASSAGYAASADTAASFVSSDSTFAISNTSDYITSVASANSANNVRVGYIRYYHQSAVGTGTTHSSNVPAQAIELTTQTTTIMTAAPGGGAVYQTTINTVTGKADMALFLPGATARIASTASTAYHADTAQSFVSSDHTYAISDTSAYITVPEQATVVSSASTAGIAKSLNVAGTAMYASDLLTTSSFTANLGSTTVQTTFTGALHAITAKSAFNADVASLASGAYIAFTASTASTAGIAKSLSGSAFTVSSASTAGIAKSLSGSAFTVSSASTAGTAKALSGSAFTVSSASTAGTAKAVSLANGDPIPLYSVSKEIMSAAYQKASTGTYSYFTNIYLLSLPVNAAYITYVKSQYTTTNNSYVIHNNCTVHATVDFHLLDKYFYTATAARASYTFYAPEHPSYSPFYSIGTVSYNGKNISVTLYGLITTNSTTGCGYLPNNVVAHSNLITNNGCGALAPFFIPYAFNGGTSRPAQGIYEFPLEPQYTTSSSVLTANYATSFRASGHGVPHCVQVTCDAMGRTPYNVPTFLSYINYANIVTYVY